VKHALLRTLPGRAIVIGLATKFAVALLRSVVGETPAFVSVFDTVASIAVAAGGGYFLVRGMALARRRLLWRVRRKLIISYIFVGFVPAILIAAFFLLGGLFLFSNFSSYLVQNRFRALTDRAASIASTTAIEIQRAGGRDVAGILARRRDALENEFPEISLAVVPMHRPCAAMRAGAPAPADASSPRSIESAGRWSFVEPPTAVPDWVDCKGVVALFAAGDERTPSTDPAGGFGVFTPSGSLLVGDVSSSANLDVIVRAVAFPESANPAYAVIVDLPVDAAVRQQLRTESGAELQSVQPISSQDRPPGTEAAHPLPRRAKTPGAPTAQAPASTPLPLTAVSFLDYRDWTSGQTGTLIATVRLSVAEIYSRISGQGSGNRQLSQGLLLVLLIIGVLFLIIEAVALAMGLALARSIWGSVHELFTGTERVRQGDFTHRIAVTAPDQLGELAESFNSMTASIEDLLLQAAEKKRLEEELRIAHEIQMSLLPQGPLRMPGLSVTALCVPAREVGGDYYDFFPLDDDRVGVLIADVSGKGTSAALYMAELKGLMLSLSRIYSSPRELLINANRIISQHLDARSFITMTYAIIDLHARSMVYARAGHTPLIYVPGPQGETRLARILAPEGLVLGLKLDNGEMFEKLLEEDTISLAEGDLYLFFTDGITEAMNGADDLFGEHRLARLVEEHAHLPAEELRERVLREIASFVGDAPQHDDMTMILLKIENVAAVAAGVDNRQSAVNHQLA
jgi:sigma-B regulation protein RsbU (phosphoserine phosphatase)